MIKMNIANLVVMITLSFAFFTTPALADENMLSNGRYLGVLEHTQLQMQQLARLELVMSRGLQNQLQINAILTLHFGDFRSREYMTYHYENVRFDPIAGRMTLEQSDQDLTILISRYSPTQIIGEVRAKSAGFVGQLKLTNVVIVEPTLPLIQPLWGEYQSDCAGAPKYLQLQTFRSNNDTHRSGDPFSSYQISGQLAEKDEGLCPRLSELEPIPRCVFSSFGTGSFNFFKGENALTLLGRPRNLNCSIKPDGLECGTCKYVRTSADGALEENYAWSPEAQPFSSPPPSSEPLGGISGDYLGYIYHEYLQVYQPVKLNIVAFQDPASDQETLRISAVASAYFGDFDSAEVLNYQFSERSFPIFAQGFVLDRPEADLDPMVRVDSFANGVIKGVWFSQLFGRVGPFELRKNEASPLPAGVKLMQPVGGVYESRAMNLTVATGQGRAPLNSENPFATLMIKGHFYYKSGIAARIPIIDGSYDFYTGRIGFVVDEGDRFSMGATKPGEQTLELKWIAKKFGTIMQAHKPERFQLTAP